jgi:NAD(P)-dependent dehydrogenase (short-subunit alcohol dehydrogenase family)
LLTQPFAEALAEAEKIITAAPFVASEQDLAEGYDYLAGSIQASLRLAWAYQRDFPYFVQSTGPYNKMGLDNPDTLYFHAYLRDDAEYVVTGRRGSTADLSFQVLKGDYSPVEVPDSLSAFDDRAIEVDGDGSFELRFGQKRPGRNYFRLGAGSSMLLVREVYSDWSAERRGTISIRREDRAGYAPPPAGPDVLAKRYGVAGKILLTRLRTFLAFPEWFYLKEPVNTMTPPRPTPGGLATQFSSAGHFDLGEDQAMIVTVPAARRDVAPYQGIQLGSMWYVSLDYINHQTSLTADQRARPRRGQLAGAHRPAARVRADPLAAADPGPGRGGRAAGRGGPVRRACGPAAVLRRRAGVTGAMAGADRRPPGRHRGKDAGLMMLQDKVVVVAGLGPGLGRSIALASAREGADVVLAARTAARLDDVAKEIAGLGRRGLAVPTDLADPAAADHLAEAALDGFGRVDALVYNALAMPPIKDLGEVSLEALNASFDANVVGALRLIRLFTPALAESAGSVVMINSMVVRFSQRTMGPYKLTKAAMLAMAQSLATEFGPRGIRVNSVAPGHIWGDSLKWYFGYLAHKRGVEVQEIYDETAAAIDLRRLPEPDEIADAVVFLASPLARAVTGQCLDVNCGEYHH